MELISKLPLDVRTDAVQAEVQVYGLRQEVMRASVFSQRGGVRAQAPRFRRVSAADGG